MTTVSLAELRSRLYEAYATQHADCGDDKAAALVYRRDIRPLLPSPAAGPIVDLGCGRGEIVRLLATAAGFGSVLSRSSPPVAHGLASAARVTVWQVVSACYRITLAAEQACYAATSSPRT